MFKKKIMSRNFFSLGDAINEYLKSSGMDVRLAEKKAVGAWEKLMGKMIARHTLDIYIKDKTLFLKLDSSVLREELSFAKEKIKDTLNKEARMRVIEKVVIT
jgi:predicted nucleic acid-binding Zn ribbon protein